MKHAWVFGIIYDFGNGNYSDIGTGLYGVFCKKFRMLLLHDHFGHMLFPGPFQKQLKNNYLIFMPNYFITTYFSH
jgi:hypothetical protein